MRERSIVSRDGTERPIDALIYGTGFAATAPIAPTVIRGVGGLTLDEAWRDGLSAYLGTTVAGFPNLFTITGPGSPSVLANMVVAIEQHVDWISDCLVLLSGPNTGLGHTSVVFMIEAQVHYVLACLRVLRRQGGRAVAVRAGAQRDFNAWLQRRMTRTVWASGCRSWYLDARGKNVTLWPSFTWDYWLRTRRVHAADYTFTRA